MRNGTILSLILTGNLLLIWAVSEDPPAARLVAAAGCFLLAYVYAQITRPGHWSGRDRG